jgi:hypothetical protein
MSTPSKSLMVKSFVTIEVAILDGSTATDPLTSSFFA